MLGGAMRAPVAMALIAATLAGCTTVADGELEPPSRTIATPLKFSVVKPLTQVHVKGKGALDVETDYLPKVVCCENGAAHPEALKAQAVMARTYMYFRYFEDDLGTAATPLSGTVADQAYFCNNAASDACRTAVEATAGEVMTFEEGGVTYANVAFFVDGPRPACVAKKSCSCPVPSATTAMTPQDHPAACECFTFASQGAANPAYVTYNWNKTGADVTGSSLGNTKHESNHGCASQNIENCLGYAGWAYPEMLKFHYGQDLQLRTADGAVVAAAGDGIEDGASSSSGATSGPKDAAPTEDEGCRASSRRAAVPGGSLLLAVLGLALLRRRRRAQYRA